MKNIHFARIMAIALVVGFCAQVSGMEIATKEPVNIAVTLSVSKKIIYYAEKEDRVAIFIKKIDSKEKPIFDAYAYLPNGAVTEEQGRINAQKEKVLFRGLFNKTEHEDLVEIDKATYQQKDRRFFLDKNWRGDVPESVWLKFKNDVNILGEYVTGWDNYLPMEDKKMIFTFPKYLPYALVKKFVKKPFEYEFKHGDDVLKVIFSLDEASKDRFKKEAELENSTLETEVVELNPKEEAKLEQKLEVEEEQKPKANKDASWRAKLRSAMPLIAGLAVATGIGIWAYKNPNRLSDFFSGLYNSSSSFVMRYLNRK